MKKEIIFFLFFSVFCIEISYAQRDTAIHIIELPLLNMYKIDEGLYRSEQPNTLAFIALEKFGIQEVLNLRNHHNDTDEGSETKISLYRVEMRAGKIKDEEIIEALRIIHNRQGSLLFHCKHGSDRTGVVCAMYRMVYQKWSKEEALAELKTSKYGFHKIFCNIPKYIENADIETIRKQLTTLEIQKIP